MEVETSLGEKLRLTLETAVARFSTAPHCLTEQDDEVGDEEEAGVGDRVRVDVDDSMDM